MESPNFVPEEEKQRKFKSATEMARAIGYELDPETRYGYPRIYWKKFEISEPEEEMDPQVHLNAVAVPGGEDIDLTVMLFPNSTRVRRLGRVQSSGYFLNLLRDAHVDESLLSRLEALKTPNRAEMPKDQLRAGGYNIVARVLQEAEQKGVFQDQFEWMNARHKIGRVKLDELIQRHEEQYPQFQTFDQYNYDARVVFMSDKTLKSGRRRGVSFRLTNSSEYTGSMEIRFGTARIIQNEEGQETLENYIETPMPKLPSTGYGYHDKPYGELFDTVLNIRQKYNEELKI